MADPLGSMDTIQAAMDDYVKNVADYYSQYEDSKKQLDEATKTVAQIYKEKGEDAARKYQMDVYYPLTHQTAAFVLNYRFNALAALSLRTFVAGRMYVTLKARYITNSDDPAWKDFLAKYDAFLATFEQSITPQLVDPDI